MIHVEPLPPLGFTWGLGSSEDQCQAVPAPAYTAVEAALAPASKSSMGPAGSSTDFDTVPNPESVPDSGRRLTLHPVTSWYDSGVRLTPRQIEPVEPQADAPFVTTSVAMDTFILQASTPPVASWYDSGVRLTLPLVMSWYDRGVRLTPRQVKPFEPQPKPLFFTTSVAMETFISKERRTMTWDLSFKGFTQRATVDAGAKTDVLFEEATRAFGLPQEQFKLVVKGKRLDKGVDLSDVALLPSAQNKREVLIVLKGRS
eukprot:CAMPEP_0183344630 /NCGR_PEP_ID=MMETSP0164_2-20130417/10259_1 /TAXON_ID=221442 /ORGANISM="Coccolithus pelagicus ssp braarudi, Strain PLY182g" /LENGTH=257 /DNA_ID=CAMNT_0025515653 /DNA_START=136 /DNA_END=909 /DNA_ORIENTATION=-